MMISTAKTILASIMAIGVLSASAIDLDDLLNPDAAILKQKPAPAKPEPTKPAPAKQASTAQAPTKQAEPVKPQPKPESKPTFLFDVDPPKSAPVPAPTPVVSPEAQRRLEAEREARAKAEEASRKAEAASRMEREARTKAEADSKAEREARAKAEEASRKAEAASRIEREARAKAEADSKAEREARAKAEAASKKAHGDLADAVAERRELEKERKELEKERNALETRLKAAEEARKEAEKKAAAAEAARRKSEAEIGDVAKKALAERQAREQAEASRRAAEQRAENERRAAEKAVADKAAIEKRLNYLMNPDPDERAEPKAKTKDEAKAVGVVKDGDGKSATTSAGDDAKGKDGKRATAGKADDKKKVAAQKKPLTGREAVITAERTDYDRKEGVILFDRNVHVDDEQYQMHADRLFVFLDGTNELKRLVAIGHVAITNEEKTAYCTRATYSKATGKIVMYSNNEIKARLHDGGKKGSTVIGDLITFWVNSEQVEVENPVISMPGGALKGGDAKDILKGGMLGGDGKKTEAPKKEEQPKGGDK